MEMPGIALGGCDHPHQIGCDMGDVAVEQRRLRIFLQQREHVGHQLGLARTSPLEERPLLGCGTPRRLVKQRLYAIPAQ